MSKKYQLRLKASKIISITIGAKKPLSVSQQLKYFGTHTKKLKSKIEKGTEKDFISLMEYVVKRLPVNGFKLSFSDDPFTMRLNDIADKYDTLYSTFHYFQNELDYEEFKTVIEQSKGNVSQFIAERYYLSTQRIDTIDFTKRAGDVATSGNSVFFKAINQQYQTLSTDLAKNQSILNMLNAGILALMLAKHVDSQKKQDEANAYLEDSSNLITSLCSSANHQEQQIKRKAGALKTQIPYNLAKLELLRLLEIAAVQRTYKTPNDLIDSLVSDMKFFANTKNGKKPTESNMEKIIRKWLLKEKNINLMYNRCLKNCHHP
ncbi:hypothetical protein U3C50_000638 [Providencia rettgeri]|nr:hypothetical protein [Providencia rettgeri]